MGQGDSNFSSRQQIVENFKLEAPPLMGTGQGGCITSSHQRFLATAENKEDAKQYDGLVLWTSALDQMVLDKISNIYLLSLER